MISFINLKNPDSVVVRFLKLSGIKIDSRSIVEELERHPDYPSLLAISDVLNNFAIHNRAFRIDFDQLNALPLPFIAHTKKNCGEFTIVTGINDRNVTVSQPRRSMQLLSLEEFQNQYAGIVLVTEINRAKIIVPIDKRVWVILGLLIVFGYLVGFHTPYFSSATWQETSLGIFKTIGLTFSILLLIQSIDENNPLVQKLCQSGGKNNDCKAVLSSNAAKAFRGLSWSEVGFFYFAGTWLLSLFGGQTVLIFSFLLLLNIVSLPYTVWSIYYQARVAKQWCVLCCAIQGIFWLEFATLFPSVKNMTLSLGPTWPASLYLILVCVVSPIILWSVLKPLLLNVQQLDTLKQQLRLFKYNTESFNKLLIAQPKYSIPDEDWSITLGNVEASNIITMVTNPYCPPCARTHRLLDELLDQNLNVQARIVFTATNTEQDMSTFVSRHMMALQKLPDKDIIRNAMHDWYEEKQKNYETWANLYPVKLNEDDFYKLDRQKTWCQIAEIKGTPTFLLNGHLLPSQYQLPDLKYMLE
jgi:uncharacterized membrane protein/glutaredoxin